MGLLTSPGTRASARASARAGGGRYPRPGGSAVAGRERKEPGVAAEVGESRQLLHVALPVHDALDVALSQVEEEPLDEQVDQLLEQPVLQQLVPAHQLERAEHVVLLLAHPLHEALVCVHDRWFSPPAVDSPAPWVPLFGAPIRALRSRAMAVSAYILIQTEVGKA